MVVVVVVSGDLRDFDDLSHRVLWRLLYLFLFFISKTGKCRCATITVGFRQWKIGRIGLLVVRDTETPRSSLRDGRGGNTIQVVWKTVKPAVRPLLSAYARTHVGVESM